MRIPDEILILNSTDGFISEYWRVLSDYSTCKEAYESLETRHLDAFGRRRYSDFESFRRVLYRKMRRK